MPAFFERLGHVRLVRHCHLLRSQCAALQAASKRDSRNLRKIQRQYGKALRKHEHRSFKLDTLTQKLEKQFVKLLSDVKAERAENTQLRGFVISLFGYHQKLVNNKVVSKIIEHGMPKVENMKMESPSDIEPSEILRSLLQPISDRIQS